MPNPRRSNTRIPLAALFAAALCTAAFPLSAATITVDSVEVNDFDDGICTLREAILAANQDVAYHGCSTGSGLDQIDFSLPPASTILVMNVPLPAVTEPVAIIGPGEEELTIDGSGLQPIFLVDSAAAPISFSLSYLTVAHGHATGSGAGGAVTVLAGDSGIFQRVVFRDTSPMVCVPALVLRPGELSRAPWLPAQAQHLVVFSASYITGALADAMKQGQERGFVRKDVQVEEVAWFILIVYTGCVSFCRIMSTEHLEQAVFSQIQTYVAGLRP